MQFSPEIVAAIMALFGVGIIGIIEGIKSVIKAIVKKSSLPPVLNLGIAAAASFGATAIFLLQAGLFSVLALIGYGVIVFGEATGLYYIYVNK